MAESRFPGVGSGDRPPAVSWLGEMARRMARVLVDHGSPESGAPQAADFLSRWADELPDDLIAPAPILGRLAVQFQLTDVECDLIVLAGLAEEHEGIAATFRSLNPYGEPRPTLGLAALLLGGLTADRHRLRELLSTGAAVRHGLLQLSKHGTFFERSLLLAEALWPALQGHDGWPTELRRVSCGPAPAGLDGWLAESAPSRAARAIADDDGAVVLVSGEDETICLARCAALAERAGRDVVAARLTAADGERLQLLAVHAAARDAVPVAVSTAVPESAADVLAVGDLPGTLLACAVPGTVRPAPHRPVISVPATRVAPLGQLRAWEAALPDLGPEVAASLTARHPLDPAITAQIGLDLRGHELTTARAEVAALIRTRAAASLPPGVELVTPHIGWSQLVLPPEGAGQLAEAVARLDHQALVLEDWGMRHRAHALHGARLLFTGPPGTGKSLAAQAVATAAGTDLLVVDVSRLVSKWLGETEKNLSAAFEAAERTQAVLMLDEADALFGSRTEITDAHDRYANLETAYLLQRLDRFEGLTILTTNLRANIDVAFLRRIDYVVEFPLPDRAGRAELWRFHLPPEALADDVEVDALAGLYPVPGAWIRNASVTGAFSAAANGGQVTQQHLVAAMRREYAKAALPFPGEPPRRRHDRAS